MADKVPSSALLLEDGNAVGVTTPVAPIAPPIGPSDKKPPKPKKMTPRSKVWDHFTKFANEYGVPKAFCNYCEKVYNADTKRYGTSTLQNHLKSCIHCPEHVDPSQPNIVLKTRDGESTVVQAWKFDPELCRKKMVAMIVLDELPFRFVEGKGFIDFVEHLQPKFKIPSRWTISRDIDKIYWDERGKLVDFFKTSGVCVSLTTDTWTSIQKINYMCITAHYIDKDWKLHKNIITFCVVDSHKGDDMGKLIDGCLRDWGIQRLYAITVDNAASNKTCLDFLRMRFQARSVGVVGGEYFHIRCTAHILNLIVGEGLKVLNQSIIRVREAVRYERQSPARVARFKTCCAELGIETKSYLSLDVATRWNSTYKMLNTTQKFQRAFDSFLTSDPTFLRDSKEGAPSDLDWVVVREIMSLLKEFYEVTLRVSGSSYVTAHTAFHEIDTIGKLLNRWLENPNPQIKEIVLAMKTKYDKYWGSFQRMSKLYWVGVIVDPHFKLIFLEYYLRKEYGDYESQKFVFDVKTTLDNLYGHYQALHHSKSSVGAGGSKDQEVVKPAAKKPKYNTADDWFNELLESGDAQLKSDLDIYLSEKPLGMEKKNFDILKWWDTQQCRFPVLSHLARDVLAFPISSVPSECAFSTSGRVLDPFRSSLSPRLVESLLCVQDWLKSVPYEVVIEEDPDNIEKHEEGLEKSTITSTSSKTMPTS